MHTVCGCVGRGASGGLTGEGGMSKGHFEIGVIINVAVHVFDVSSLSKQPGVYIPSRAEGRLSLVAVHPV